MIVLLSEVHSFTVHSGFVQLVTETIVCQQQVTFESVCWLFLQLLFFSHLPFLSLPFLTCFTLHIVQCFVFFWFQSCQFNFYFTSVLHVLMLLCLLLFFPAFTTSQSGDRQENETQTFWLWLFCITKGLHICYFMHRLINALPVLFETASFINIHFSHSISYEISPFNSCNRKIMCPVIYHHLYTPKYSGIMCTDGPICLVSELEILHWSRPQLKPGTILVQKGHSHCPKFKPTLNHVSQCPAGQPQYTTTNCRFIESWSNAEKIAKSTMTSHKLKWSCICWLLSLQCHNGCSLLQCASLGLWKLLQSLICQNGQFWPWFIQI